MTEYLGKEIRPDTSTGPSRIHGGAVFQSLQTLHYVTNWYYNDAEKNTYNGREFQTQSSDGPIIIRGGAKPIDIDTMEYVSNWFSDDSDKNIYTGGYYCIWTHSSGPTIVRGGLKEVEIKVLYAPERMYGGMSVMNILKSFGPYRPDKTYDTNIEWKSTIRTGGLVPSEPTDVTITTNKNGFRINWSNPESVIDGRPLTDYGVFISDDGYNFLQTDSVSVSRFVYGDVFPTNTKYISIRAGNFNGYGRKSTIFELNPSFDYDPQIIFSRKTSEDSMQHGLYSSHNPTDDSGNSVFFGLWTPQCLDEEVGRKKIIEFNAESGVNTIHILPIENDKYSIGSDDKPFLSTTGSEIYTDTIKTKIFKIHSGK